MTRPARFLLAYWPAIVGGAIGGLLAARGLPLWQATLVTAALCALLALVNLAIAAIVAGGRDALARSIRRHRPKRDE